MDKLEEVLINRDKLAEFQDQWNPMRFRSYLQYHLKMPKELALKKAGEYQVMYDNLMQGYEIYRRTTK